MKKFYFPFLIFIVSCSTSPQQKYVSFGAEITSEEAKEVQKLNEMLESNDSVAVKFTADIEAVCQMKGCWMTLKNEEGSPIRVTFKDYGFFVPKDASGKQTIVSGIAKKVVLSESEARHYAEDQGISYDSTKIYSEISFVADGVLIADSPTNQ